MPVDAPLQQRCSGEEARLELEAVLNSATFLKAPNPSRILRYLCERYLAGDTAPVKEYQLAVEVFGRSDEYQQQEKSTVRVEAYRLRRKLKRYYEGEGADHQVRILVEPGQYAARFAPADEAHLPGNPAEVVQEHGSKRLWFWFAVGGALLVGIALTALITRRSVQPPGPVRSASAMETVAGFASNEDVRILAGYPRANYIDVLGRVWRGDAYFNGGQAMSAPRRFLSRTADPTLFRYYRRGIFSYDIPVAPGVYELHLYFAPAVSHWSLSEQPAQFDVRLSINGVFKIIKTGPTVDSGGAPAADERVFRNVSPAADGRVHIQFFNRADYGFVSALELLRDSDAHIRPVRLRAHRMYYTDRVGRIWRPDGYFNGGQLVERSEPVEDDPDPDLYSGERYGAFDYLIPVADGTYAVTLWFAETFYGPGMPGAGGVGSRVLSVRCNGQMLLDNFDVLRASHEPKRVVSRTFHGIRPNAEGKLLIEFLKGKGDAMVNALEILDETP